MKRHEIAKKSFGGAGIDSKQESAGRPSPTLAEDAAMLDQHLRSNPLTTEFFHELVGNDDPRVLTSAICRLLRTLDARPTVKSLRRAKGFGKNMRMLESYPKSLKRWAGEIKKKSAMLFPIRRGLLLSEQCERFLLMLADEAEIQWKTRKESPINALRVWDSYADGMLEELTNLVELRTGSQNDEKLTNLLAAAAEVLDTKLSFDPDALKMSRHRRKVRQINSK